MSYLDEPRYEGALLAELDPNYEISDWKLLHSCKCICAFHIPRYAIFVLVYGLTMT